MASDKLKGWLLSPEATTSPLDAVEREVESGGREVLRLMLQAHMQARGTGDIGPRIVATGEDGASLGRGRVHERKVATVVAHQLPRIGNESFLPTG